MRSHWSESGVALHRAVGSICREQGADVLILAPNPVNEDYASAVRRAHKAFAKLN